MRLPSSDIMASSVSARLPTSVHSWLGHELELRGIDAVIYTRYILSLLQQDESECEAMDAPFSKREARSKFPTKWRPIRTKRRRSEEEVKKSAVIECLMSLSESEEDVGIESLVDELYLKLKEEQDLPVSVSAPALVHPDGGDSSGTESDDPAERYYAAFPALSKETENLVSRSQPSEGTVWAKVAQRSLGRGEVSQAPGNVPLPHHAENKENQAVKRDTSAMLTERRDISRTPGGAMRKEERNKWSSRIIGYSQQAAHHKRRGPLSLSDHNRLPSDDLYSRSHPSALARRHSPCTPEWYSYPLDGPGFVVPKVTSAETKLGYRVCGAEMFDRLHHPRPHYKSVLRGKEWLERLMELIHSRDSSRAEDQTWYTQPLEELLPATPIPLASQRLYRRHTTTPEPGLEVEEEEAPGDLALYLHQLREHLEQELARQEAQQQSPPGDLHLDGDDLDSDTEEDSSDEEEEDMDWCLQDLWNMSVKGSEESTPTSSENEMPEELPVSPLLEPGLSVDTALAWLTPNLPSGLGPVNTHSLWACQHAPAAPATLWLPLLGCDNCQSNRRDPLGACSPVRAPYLDLLVSPLPSPMFTVGSPWRPLSQPLPCPLTHLLSPKADGGLTSQLWDINVTSQIWDMKTTSQIWDVNIPRRACMETPQHDLCHALETIHSYLLHLNIEPSFKPPVFIKGGLYGRELCPQDGIWEHREELLVGDEEDEDVAWDCPRRERLLRQRSSSCEDLQNKREKAATEIVPSPNTAFTSLIPARLPHVQSEPSLQCLLTPCDSPPLQTQSARLVQVKSIYKSDSSILTQLGLANEASEQHRQKIELSPDTHFRPIHTPNENKAGIELDFNPTEESEDGLGYLLGRRSRYQLYLGEETDDMVKPCFVPKFRVKKDYEKSIQTGHESKEEERCAEGHEMSSTESRPEVAAHMDCLEMLFSADMQDELELSMEDAHKLTMEDMHNYDFFSSPPASPEIPPPDKSLEELGGLQLAGLWQSEGTPAELACRCQEAGQVWRPHKDSCHASRRWPGEQTPTAGTAEAWPGEITPTLACPASPPTRYRHASATSLQRYNGTGESLSDLICDLIPPGDSCPPETASTPVNGDKPWHPQSSDLTHSHQTDGPDPRLTPPHQPSCGFGGIHIATPIHPPPSVPASQNVDFPCAPSFRDSSSHHSSLCKSPPLNPGSLPKPSIMTHSPDFAPGSYAEPSNLTCNSYGNSSDLLGKSESVGSERAAVGYRSIWSYDELPAMPYREATVLAEEYASVGHADVVAIDDLGSGDDGMDDTAFLEETCMPRWSTAEDEVEVADDQDKSKETEREKNRSDLSWFEDSPNAGDRSMFFSADLEELWLQDNKDFEVQVPRRPHHRSRSGSQQKPCSFFLEGHCRRSDCKFAHDVSCITCRFWEEGCCFKGLTCPFLHGYATVEPESPRPVPKRKDWKDFQFDEDDFPVLSKSQEERSAAMDIKETGQQNRICSLPIKMKPPANNSGGMATLAALSCLSQEE